MHEIAKGGFIVKHFIATMLVLLLPIVGLASYQKMTFQTDYLNNVFAPDFQINEKSDGSVQVKYNVTELEYKASEEDLDAFDLRFSEHYSASAFGRNMLPKHSFLVEAKPEDLEVVSKNLFQTEQVNDFRVSRSLQRGRKFRCTPRNAVQNINLNNDDFHDNLDKDFYSVEYLGDLNGKPISRITTTAFAYSQEKNQLEVKLAPQFDIKSKDSNQVKVLSNDSNAISLTPQNNHILIVSPRVFIKDLKYFAHWKRKLGFRVTILAKDQLGETANQIKDSLAKIYHNPKTKYSFAILVGDEEIFPTFYKFTSSSSKTPSDLPYFTFGGQGDFIPDVFYGRFVVRSNSDLRGQIFKILEYEAGNYHNAAALLNGMVIASNEGYQPSDEDYAKTIATQLKHNHKSRFAYLFQRDQSATNKNILKTLSVGNYWISYFGHGSGYDWSSTNEYFGVEDLKNMGVPMVKPVIIDVACQNGRFEDGRFGESFMNLYVNNKPSGATAYYGGSVNISWHPPAIMSTGIELYRHAYGLHFLGQALLGGQLYLANNFSDVSEIKDNFTWFHLFGDPSMRLRHGPPKSLKIYKKDGYLVFHHKEGSLKKQRVVFHNNKNKFIIRYTNDVGAVKIPAEQGIQNYSILSKGFRYYEGQL